MRRYPRGVQGSNPEGLRGGGCSRQNNTSHVEVHEVCQNGGELPRVLCRLPRQQLVWKESLPSLQTGPSRTNLSYCSSRRCSQLANSSSCFQTLPLSSHPHFLTPAQEPSIAPHCLPNYLQTPLPTILCSAFCFYLIHAMLVHALSYSTNMYWVPPMWQALKRNHSCWDTINPRRFIVKLKCSSR